VSIEEYDKMKKSRAQILLEEKPSITDVTAILTGDGARHKDIMNEIKKAVVIFMDEGMTDKEIMVVGKSILKHVKLAIEDTKK
jgi:hypothetical protein